MTLTREQVEWICSGSSAVKETLKQLADTDAALRQRVDELERDQHKPTVTYWMNQFTLMQQEAKKRFDDWFVLRQQVDDLTAKLAKAEKTMSGAWVSMGEKVKRIEELKAKLETVVQDYEASQHLADATSKEPT